MKGTPGILEHLFLEPNDLSGGRIILEGEGCFHLARVKRARRGEEVTWSDGAGRVGRAVIEEIGGNSVSLRVTEEGRARRKKPRLILYQALPKSGKMDGILRRCTEVGVDRFRPFVSSRTLPGLVRAGVPEKMTRWNKVLREAARQSRRDFLPELELPLSWEGFLECLEEGHLTLLAWEEEKERRVLDALPREAPESVALVVGPEGGFSVREVEEMREAGAVTVSLGSNILRTENAGMVMAVLAGGFYGRI